MIVGWSVIARPLHDRPIATGDRTALPELLLADGECGDADRIRIMESLAEDIKVSIAHGELQVSGELVLDMPGPAWVALALLFPNIVSRGGVELLSRWATVANMPHRERDVFHFPWVANSPELDAVEKELNDRRRHEIDRLISDQGLVGYVTVDPSLGVKT